MNKGQTRQGLRVGVVSLDSSLSLLGKASTWRAFQQRPYLDWLVRGGSWRWRLGVLALLCVLRQGCVLSGPVSSSVNWRGG